MLERLKRDCSCTHTNSGRPHTVGHLHQLLGSILIVTFHQITWTRTPPSPNRKQLQQSHEAKRHHTYAKYWKTTCMLCHRARWSVHCCVRPSGGNIRGSLKMTQQFTWRENSLIWSSDSDPPSRSVVSVCCSCVSHLFCDVGYLYVDVVCVCVCVSLWSGLIIAASACCWSEWCRRG